MSSTGGDGLFLCYKELNPSTSVVGSVFFRSYNQFTREYDDFLCTITPSIFNIYQVQRDLTGSKCLYSLEFLKFSKVFGKLQDVRRMTRDKEEHDLLILAIDEGKLVAAEYDPCRNQLHEYPIGNLEQNAIGIGADLAPVNTGRRIHPGPGSEPLLKVNSTYDIVASVIYGENLFLSTITSNWEVNSHSTLERTFTYEKVIKHIRQHLRLEGPILDIEFVHGYNNPTLAILHQEYYLPVGHVKRVRHTCAVSVFTVDLANQTVGLLWSKSHLPHDSLKLGELKNKAVDCSVLIISQNAIIIANEHSIHALPVNSFASISVTNDMKIHPWTDSKVGIELDGSYWSEYGEDSLRETALMGFLRDGTVVLVRLLFVLHQVFNSLHFDVLLIGESSVASTISILPEKNLLFVGTRTSQKNILYEIIYKKSDAIKDELSLNQLENARKWFFDLTAPDQKLGEQSKQTVKKENEERMKHVLNNYDDDDDLMGDIALNEEILNEERLFYGKTAIELDPSYQMTRKFDWIVTLAVQDFIHNFGPILSGIFTKNEDLFNHLQFVDFNERSTKRNNQLLKTNQTAASYINERDSKDSLIIASGSSNNSALHRVSQGIGFHKVGTRNFVGASRVFTVPIGESGDLSTKTLSNFLLVSYETKTRILLSKVLSNNLSIMPEIKFQEYGDESGLFTTSPTVFVGKINTDSNNDLLSKSSFEILVQVIPLGIRLIKISAEGSGIHQQYDCSPVQDMLLLEEIDIGGLGGKHGESILSADICFGYLTLLTNYRRLFLLKYNFEDEVIELLFCKEFQPSNDDINNLGNKSLFLPFIQSEIVSASLFYGEISLSTADAKENEEVSERKDQIDERYLSPVEREELLFYGSLLKDLDENGISRKSEEPAVTSSNESIKKGAVKAESFGYLVVYEENGFLTIVRLSDFACVLRTPYFTIQNEYVKNEVNLNARADPKSELSKKLSNRYVVESRLVYLSYSVNEHNSLSIKGASMRKRLCLCLLFHTGELVVYHGFQRSCEVFSWYKDNTKVIHNKRYNYGKLLKTQLSESIALQRANSFDSQNPASDYVSFLETDDYLQRTPQTLNVMKNFHNCSDVILISANDPLIYSIEKGNSSLMPVGFPETPYVNSGMYTVLPFYSPTAANSPTAIIASLWYEYEDIEALRNPMFIKHRAQRQTTFGLYSLLPNQQFAPYENISLQTIDIPGQTIHKVFEIAKLTDNTTEQALLDKKTYVLFTSKDIYKDFDENLHLTKNDDEGKDPEDIMYERYYPLLDSFKHPDTKLAPHALMKDKEHRISLFQSGKIIDSFLISEKEIVVDITPLYFSVEKTVTQTSGIITSTMKVYEKRVFLLVSVLNKDHRGEDSQGNGKLLLLGFDYSMFDEDLPESESNNDPSNENSNKENETNGDAMDVDQSRAEEKSSANSAKNAQQQFLGAIQAKLKLLWTGPGPASVVQQMPAFIPTVSTYNPNPVNPNTPTDSTNATQMFSNYVVATVGATLYIYKLNPNTMELDQITFFFSQFYITSVSVVKNMIIMCDMFHSVSLLYFREEDVSLHLVSKDFDHRTLPRCDFLLDGPKLGIITTDDRENIQLFQQTRKKVESLSGTRLLCLSEFHLGSEVSCLISHDLLLPEYQNKKQSGGSNMPGLPPPPPLPPNPPGMPPMLPHGLPPGMPPNMPPIPPPPPPPPRTRRGSSFPLQIFGTRLAKLSNFPAYNPSNQPVQYHRKTTSIVLTLDGNIGYLIPLEEKLFKRLLLVQQILTTLLPTTFFLNSKEFRYNIWNKFHLNYPSFLTLMSNPASNLSNKRFILDGNVLYLFLTLDSFLQDEIAALIGVNSYVLRENLHEIEYLMRFF